MSSRTLIGGTTLVAILAVAIFTLYAPPQQKKENIVNTTAQENGSTGGQAGTCRYRAYHFHRPEGEDPFDPDFQQYGTSFGNSDSVGVQEPIATNFPNHTPAFLSIGEQRTAREQFLNDIGFVLAGSTHVWMTDIYEVGVLNGETRLKVSSCAGNDINEKGRVSLNSEVSLQEIWRLNTDGTATLLDRIRWAHHDSQGTHMGFRGFRTRQEAPVKIWAITIDPNSTPLTVDLNSPPVPTDDVW